jgi:hypothetical protein
MSTKGMKKYALFLPTQPTLPEAHPAFGMGRSPPYLCLFTSCTSRLLVARRSHAHHIATRRGKLLQKVVKETEELLPLVDETACAATEGKRER